MPNKLHTIRVVVAELTDDELRRLAYNCKGYYRENPQRAWNLKEFKEAARMRIEQLVSKDVDPDG